MRKSKGGKNGFALLDQNLALAQTKKKAKKYLSALCSLWKMSLQKWVVVNLCGIAIVLFSKIQCLLSQSRKRGSAGCWSFIRAWWLPWVWNVVPLSRLPAATGQGRVIFIPLLVPNANPGHQTASNGNNSACLTDKLTQSTHHTRSDKTIRTMEE